MLTVAYCTITEQDVTITIVGIIILFHDVMRFPFYNTRYSISCSMIFIHYFVDEKQFIVYSKNVNDARMSFKLKISLDY